MRKRFSWLVVVFAFALLAAACSSDDGGDTTTTAGSGGETTTTAATPGDTTTTTEAPPAEMQAGRGVDVESKTITLGLLADLTGLFATLVIDITDAQSVYFDNLNAAGGIDGWSVELVIEDTNYNVEQHQEKYAKIKDEVLGISQSTGSPTNVATLDEYIADDMLVIPLSWYSGWAIPEFDQGVMFEQNTNYCLESMNIVAFAVEQGFTKIGLATFPGDYGQDAAAGVKKAVEFYGLELVYDGEAAVIPGQDYTEVIQGIATSGAEFTILTTNPSIGAEIMGGAVQAGYTGMFSGNSPTYNPALLASPVAPIIDAAFYQSGYNVGWGVDTPGNNAMMDAMRAVYPDRLPSDAFITGWNEAISMEAVIRQAIANNDLTPAGFVAAAAQIESIDFGGTAPNQSYAGTPNEYVQRESAIFKPTLSVFEAAGGLTQTLTQPDATTGSVPVGDFFAGDAAAEYEFSAPCYEL